MALSLREFERVIGYTRKATARQLDHRKLQGVEVSASPKEGRHARCWLNGQADGGRPIVVELHGGGFALGDARKGDGLREWIARRYDALVVGVDYRLAPEHPYPAALEDVVAAVKYLSRRFPGDDGLPPRVYLLGFSAGANLALAATLAQLDDPSVRISGLDLHYPMVDASDRPVDGGGSTGLPHDLMVAFSAAYAAGCDLEDPGISPGLAADGRLRKLPFTTLYPVVGDPLFNQVELLHRRMVALGCPVAWHPVEGMYHGYIEDAEDVAIYRATTMPDTMAARPTGFVEVAVRELDASLAELLGPACHDVAFPSLEEGGLP